MQVIDLLEIYREIAEALGENYVAAICYRMNEIMAVVQAQGLGVED